MRITDDTKIVKSNDLIEARYKLSLVQQKLILIMASLITPTNDNFKYYKISLSDLKKTLRVDNKNYHSFNELLRESIIDLSSRPLYIQEGNSWAVINWISSAEYNAKEGVVEFEFSEKLKPYLLQLRTAYTAYRLKFVINLSSTYSIRIYELLKQYERIGHRKISLNDLKKNLGVEKRYKQYGDFKRFCLKVAKRELEKKSDIDFDYEEIKSGRKVVGINFYDIRANTPEDIYNGQISLDLYINEGEPTNQSKKPSPGKITANPALLERGVSPEQVEKIVVSYRDKKISWKNQEYSVIEFYCEYFDWALINLPEEKKPKGGAWLYSAITKQWLPPEDFKTKQQQIKEDKKKQHQKQLEEDLFRQENEKKEKVEYLRWLSLSPEERWNQNIFAFRFSFRDKTGKALTREQEKVEKNKYLTNPETPEEYQIRRFGKVRYEYKNKKQTQNV